MTYEHGIMHSGKKEIIFGTTTLSSHPTDILRLAFNQQGLFFIDINVIFSNILGTRYGTRRMQATFDGLGFVDKTGFLDSSPLYDITYDSEPHTIDAYKIQLSTFYAGETPKKLFNPYVFPVEHVNSKAPVGVVLTVTGNWENINWDVKLTINPPNAEFTYFTMTDVFKNKFTSEYFL